MNLALDKKYSIVTKVDDKLSYCSTSSNINLEHLTIRDRLDYMSKTNSDKVAFIFNHINNGLKLTYLDVKNQSTILAKNFLHLGLNKGDKIAYLIPNRPELLISYFAASLIGAVSVPLDSDFGSNELKYMLEKTEPKAVIIYNSIENKNIIFDLFPEIDSSSKENFKSNYFPSLCCLIFKDDDFESKTKKYYKGAWSYNLLSTNLLTENSPEFPYVESDDLFGVFFTSGTSGRSKGVMISQYAALNSQNIAYKKELFKDEKQNENELILCQMLQMYHLGAALTILSCLIRPNLVLIFPSFKFDLNDILACIQKYKCNCLYTLPKIFLNIINYPTRNEYDLSCLKTSIVGGQIITAQLIQLAKEKLKLNCLYIGYGMTESIGLCLFKIDLAHFEPKEYDYPLGIPNFPYEVKIVNPKNGQIQPLNIEGQLHTRSLFITKGYYNDLEQTNKAIDSNGWYNTGDTISMDSNGCLHFKSRAKEIITAKGSGRLNVYPSSVEECLLSHPSVKEAVVFGININDHEEEICAWVKLQKESKINSSNELIEFCKANLMEYKVPSFIKIVDKFPVNFMGKYLRSEMQRLYKSELNL